MKIIGDNELQIRKLVLKAFDTNAYIIICLKTKDSVLIDSPDSPSLILEALNGTSLRYILLTHSHMDHIGALDKLRSQLQVPTGVHSNDANNISPFPEMLLKDGEIITIGDIKIEVLHTPGHTSGSLCFKVGRYLISGDTIFPGGPGRTWSSEGFRQIVKSIKEKIMILPEYTHIYPGHGPSTILRKEKGKFAVFTSRPLDLNLFGQVTWLQS
jgi:glyoxylase-like metal-dependent hydrolase (beta-lactamase superfamily II)